VSILEGLDRKYQNTLRLALSGETRVLEEWVLASSLIRVLVPPVCGALGAIGLSGRASTEEVIVIGI